ncbi:MAG TPA: hypothetical protein VNU45_18635 [Rummeliibacillus sp.]|nr:hypothetical protein [Rummeliibacillus sp.]
MAIAQVLVKQYGVCVYKDGTRTLASVNEAYVEPVKEYVAQNYNLTVIDNALVKGFISEEEYRETIAYTKEV